MKQPHVISSVAGTYHCHIASSVGEGSNKKLMGVLEVDEANGWSFTFVVSDHDKILTTQQLSTAIRRYNEAA